MNFYENLFFNLQINYNSSILRSIWIILYQVWLILIVRMYNILENIWYLTISKFTKSFYYM